VYKVYKDKCTLSSKILTAYCYHAVSGYPTQNWAGMNRVKGKHFCEGLQNYCGHFI